MARRKLENHVPSRKRTVSTVVNSVEFVEEIKVEGFLRGYETLSEAASKILELGMPEFKKLPVKESRKDL